MGHRMHCADCRATEVADTRLPGSDDLEALLWLLGGVPGWLYCAWRHALREKRCPLCGGEALLREARASGGAGGAARIVSDGVCLRGVGALRDPRERLARSPAWLGAWLVFASGAWLLGGALLALSALVAGREIQRLRVGAFRLRAWDAHGRPLRIEAA